MRKATTQEAVNLETTRTQSPPFPPFSQTLPEPQCHRAPSQSAASCCASAVKPVTAEDYKSQRTAPQDPPQAGWRSRGRRQRCDIDRSMPAGTGRRGLPQGLHLCWLFCAFTLKLCQAEASVPEEKQSVSTSTLPCWLVEEFVIAEECTPCSSFQAKTTSECGSTGYVEKITCSSSKRNEFKSCRSALMEQHLFWKFEGAVVGVALVFACLVIIRQRQLDRKALEKVRKQIESI